MMNKLSNQADELLYKVFNNPGITTGIIIRKSWFVLLLYHSIEDIKTIELLIQSCNSNLTSYRFSKLKDDSGYILHDMKFN